MIETRVPIAAGDGLPANTLTLTYRRADPLCVHLALRGDDGALIAERWALRADIACGRRPSIDLSVVRRDRYAFIVVFHQAEGDLPLLVPAQAVDGFIEASAHVVPLDDRAEAAEISRLAAALTGSA